VRNRVVIACIVLFASSLAAGVSAAPRDPSGDHAPGVVLVGYQRGTPASEKAAARTSVGARNASPLSPISTDTERLTLPPGLSVERAIATLSRRTSVRFAEPDGIVEAFDISDDPYYLNDTPSQNLWGMHGDAIATGDAPSGTGADEAWAAGAVGSRDVYVGIVDSGVQSTHPDLDANVWTNPFDPQNGVDDDGNGYVDDAHGWDVTDDNATVFDGAAIDTHGTHIAGTIGAEGGNAIGVAGVNWRVTMIPTRFLATGTGLVSNAVEAIDYLTDLRLRHGLRIVAINASWGSPASQALDDAIARAGDAGILVVAAAGNSSGDNDVSPTYPANTACVTRADDGQPRGHDCVLAVAATERSGAMASFSDYGPTTVDLGAPGVDVHSTLPTDTYGPRSGTSMAAPHVVGAVALCASIGPSLDAAQLRDAITSSVSSTESLADSTVTGGRLDAGALVDACTTPGAAVTGGATGLGVADVDRSGLRLDWTDGAANEQGWEVQSSVAADCAAGPWGPSDMVGTGATRMFVQGLTPDTSYCFRVRARNTFGGGTDGPWEVVGPVRTLAPLTPYACAPAAYAWIDATTGTRRTLADDASVQVGLGFTFRFHGSPFTAVQVSSNGLLGFGSTSPHRYVNTPIPDTIDPDAFAAAFWDDLDPSAGGAVWTRTTGSSPNRRFVASWNAVPAFNTPGSTLSFQIVLDEGSGRITYSYKDVSTGVVATDRGASATVGVEAPVGDAGTQVSHDTPSLADGTAIACTLPAPTVTTTSPLPAGTAGVPYTVSLGGSGGTQPVTWSWAGATPPGLTLDAVTGAISGTPAQSGSHTFAVTATDASNPPRTSAAKSLTVIIKVAKQAPAHLSTAGNGTGVTLQWWPHKGAVRYEWCLSVRTSCATGAKGTGWRSAGTATQATVGPPVWSSFRGGRTYYWQMRVVTASSTVTAVGGWWRFSVPA
jgi:subtilisin family serine protease